MSDGMGGTTKPGLASHACDQAAGSFMGGLQGVQGAAHRGRGEWRALRHLKTERPAVKPLSERNRKRGAPCSAKVKFAKSAAGLAAVFLPHSTISLIFCFYFVAA